MDNFNLRKFLIENKLTTKSKLLTISESYTTAQIIDLARKAGEIIPDAKYAIQHLAVAYGDNVPEEALNDVLANYDIELEELQDFSEPDAEDLYGDVTVSHGERKPYRGTMYETEETEDNLINSENEEEEMPSEGMDVSKYLSMEGAEAIVSELEKDSAKAYMEAKLKTLKEVINTLEGKCNSLEESEDAAFISQSKLKEMKATVKKLRKMEEKMVKEYEKKYPAKKSLKENTSSNISLNEGATNLRGNWPDLEFEYEGKTYKVEFDLEEEGDDFGGSKEWIAVGEDQFGDEWEIVVSTDRWDEVNDYEPDTIQRAPR